MLDLRRFARAIATALVTGPWDPGAMEARVRELLGPVEPVKGTDALAWLAPFVRRVRSRYAAPTSDDIPAIAAWLSSVEAFDVFALADAQIRRYPIAVAEMRESPWRVPALATPRELAMWLGISHDALDIFAARAGRHYHYAWIAKPSGGQRLVEAPKSRLRAVQRDLLDGILAAIPPHDAAHGFVGGRSVKTFAAPHVGRAVVIRVDLEAFFSSVTAARVRAILRVAGYPAPVARTIAAMCTHRAPAAIVGDAFDRDRLRTPHLPQGAPSSGALANLAAYGLDIRVAAFAASLGARYTRYADDLVLSGDRTLVRAAPTIVARLGAIAHEQGFALNFKKTRVMTAANRQRIAGVVVNERLAVARADVEQLRAILHNCARTGPSAQNRDAHPDFRAHLRGRIAWIESIDPAKGGKLRAVFERLRWDS